MRRFQIVCVALCLLGLGAVWGVAQEAPGESEARLQQMKTQADAYRVQLNDGQRTELKRVPQPLHRFSNPVSGVPDGIVVLWTAGKRPAVFAQVFQTKEGVWIQECQSVASPGLTMNRGAEVLWSPEKGMVNDKPLPQAPPPDSKPAGRALQMRSIAQKFSATDDFRVRFDDKQTVKNTLRLLPTQIYRYDSVEHGVMDGAVFAFVHGTDPEVFLILEARSTDPGQGIWHYALAPMTCWAVEVQLGGEAVWSVPERFGQGSKTSDYNVWIHRPQSP